MLFRSDLNTLVTYLADTHGFVELQEGMQKPTEENYMERAVPFNASRQKQTLIEKVERELLQHPAYRNEGDIISDWGANRVVPLTEEDAMYWGGMLSRNAKIGVFETRTLHVDDYYGSPKPSGFKNYNIALREIGRAHV